MGTCVQAVPGVVTAAVCRAGSRCQTALFLLCPALLVSGTQAAAGQLQSQHILDVLVSAQGYTDHVVGLSAHSGLPGMSGGQILLFWTV